MNQVPESPTGPRDDQHHLGRYLTQRLVHVLDSQQLRENLLLQDQLLGDAGSVDVEAPTRPIQPHVRVFNFADGEKTWQEFHDFFTRERRGNIRPWYRCLSVLRGLGCQSAIVEAHYVCLDWRSEVAAFYGFLDAPRKNYTLRIHFFGVGVQATDVTALSGDQAESYLGYIVIRQGELPLVGRTLLALPEYMRGPDTSTTAVRERVHFFGQELNVLGVPFMQQDSRFAVCAHLVAWMAHYTAYRRGILERRYIADFVSSSSNVLPMRPGTREGLMVSQVMRLFRDVGLRTVDYTTPLSPIACTLPQMKPEHFPDLDQRVRAILNSGDEPISDLAYHVYEQFQQYARDEVGLKPTPEAEPGHPTVRAVDAVLAELLRPCLDSRLPVYLATTNHAVLLVGRGTRAETDVHFIHDESNGPYLVADSLVNMSRLSLEWQTGIRRGVAVSTDRNSVPPVDPVLRNLDQPLPIGTDGWRGIENIIIPTPSRAVLELTPTKSRAIELILGDLPLVDPGLDVGAEKQLPIDAVSATLMMGIDYKRQRRDQALEAHDAAATTAFSAIHLAEWVVVVQGTDSETGLVCWELVFDGSSSRPGARLQLARVLGAFLAVNPLDPTVYDVAELQSEQWPVVECPEQLDKFMATH